MRSNRNGNTGPVYFISSIRIFVEGGIPLAGVGSRAKEKAEVFTRVPDVEVLPGGDMLEEPGLNIIEGRGGEGDQGDEEVEDEDEEAVFFTFRIFVAFSTFLSLSCLVLVSLS